MDAAQTSDARLILQRLDQMDKSIAKEFADIKADFADHETRIRALENKQTKLEGRMTNFQIGQGVYSTVAAMIAALWRGPT